MIKIKNISEFNDYFISNTGDVFSFKFGKKRLMKQQKNKKGYKLVTITRDGKSYTKFVHRLVAEAFLTKKESHLDQINHIDENKENNSFDNLEWCDSKYNNNYGKRNENMSKSIKKKIKVFYRDNTYEIWESVTDFAEEFGYKRNSIYSSLNGHRKSFYGMRFCYVD